MSAMQCTHLFLGFFPSCAYNGPVQMHATRSKIYPYFANRVIPETRLALLVAVIIECYIISTSPCLQVVTLRALNSLISDLPDPTNAKA